MSASVVTPAGATATATPLKGGAVMLSPAAVGGRRRRMSKKTRKMLRALKKLKGGEMEAAVETAEAPATEEMGGRRRRRSRRSRRRSRRSRAGLFA